MDREVNTTITRIDGTRELSQEEIGILYNRIRELEETVRGLNREITVRDKQLARLLIDMDTIRGGMGLSPKNPETLKDHSNTPKQG